MNATEKKGLIDDFECAIQDEKLCFSLAAMQSLLITLEKDRTVTTMQEFIAKMSEGRKILQAISSDVSVTSSCELLVRFITFSQTELEQAPDFCSCRKILLKRGKDYLARMQKCRSRIVENCKDLIMDDMCILVHSSSKNVLAAMLDANKNGKQFKVYVTESQPHCEGKQMADELRKRNITCTVILDSAISYVIERVDAVFLGAEGVCENGGIISKIGTCNVATLAALKNKPVYVLVESFKFIRLMPLNNLSLPERHLFPVKLVNSGADLEQEHPLVDYTPPQFLTLLYTDLGILPTSAVTEHLIKLYT